MERISLFTLMLILLFGCGSPTENVDDNTVPKEEEKEDFLSGNAQISIENNEYSLEEFLPTHSEITLMDDNKITIRLTSMDREKSIKVLVSGPDIYGERPTDITLEASQFEEANHGGITLEGFLYTKDEMDALLITDGEGTIITLDETSKDFKIEFQGEGLHQFLGDSGIQRDSIDQVSGSIEVTLDNIVDVRSN